MRKGVYFLLRVVCGGANPATQIVHPPILFLLFYLGVNGGKEASTNRR
jgi:hypothetical protein